MFEKFIDFIRKLFKRGKNKRIILDVPKNENISKKDINESKSKKTKKGIVVITPICEGDGLGIK